MAKEATDKADPSKLDPKRIGHLKRLRHLLPILSSLHDVGCERDAAGNRLLHFDEYVTLTLLCLFNPLIDSMRRRASPTADAPAGQRVGQDR